MEHFYLSSLSSLKNKGVEPLEVVLRFELVKVNVEPVEFNI